MCKWIVLFFLFISTYTAEAQYSQYSYAPQDSIIIRKNFAGSLLYQNRLRLSAAEVRETLKYNPEALKLYESSRTNTIIASVLGGIGGYMVGWTLAQGMMGRDPSWVMAGIGTGIVVATIPISKKADKKLQKAIELYNAGIYVPTVSRAKTSFNGYTGNGRIGLALHF